MFIPLPICGPSGHVDNYVSHLGLHEAYYREPKLPILYANLMAMWRSYYVMLDKALNVSLVDDKQNQMLAQFVYCFEFFGLLSSLSLLLIVVLQEHEINV